MKRIFAILIAALALFSTSMATGEDIPQQVNAPDRWEETVYSKNGKSSYIFDADIIAPQGSNLPCVEVKGHRLTQDEVDAWASYLFPQGDYEGSLTIQKGDPDHQAYGQGYGCDIWQPLGAWMSASCMENTSGAVIDSNITYCAVAGDAPEGTVFYSYGDTPLPLDGEFARGCTQSVSEAQAVADAFVKALYPTMVLTVSGALNGMPIEISTEENNREGVMMQIAPRQAYVFEYQHAPNQIPVVYADRTALYVETIDSGNTSIIYYWPLSYERLSICVNESGIQFIEYSNQYDIVQETLATPTLLPFQSIAEVIKTILPLKYMTYEYSLGSFDIMIHRLSLIHI